MAAQPQQIRIWHIDRFVLYARNPRKNDAVVDRMSSSIREFGFKIPVLARSDGEVVDGHLRIKAARKLRMTEVPVILCDEWTPAQVRAFRCRRRTDRRGRDSRVAGSSHLVTRGPLEFGRPQTARGRRN
jgi:hypothetical protein